MIAMHAGWKNSSKPCKNEIFSKYSCVGWSAWSHSSCLCRNRCLFVLILMLLLIFVLFSLWVIKYLFHELLHLIGWWVSVSESTAYSIFSIILMLMAGAKVKKSVSFRKVTVNLLWIFACIYKLIFERLLSQPSLPPFSAMLGKL